jgi:hypothetical protein
VKNIRRKAFDLKALRLSPEEGFVLSRLDAPLSVRELVALTGLEEGRIVEIVEGLATQGAIDVDRDAPPPRAAREEEEEDEEDTPQAAADDTDDSDQDEAEDPDEVEKRAAGAREFQKIYETVFHPMARDERVAAALTAVAENLFALCFDPDPQVISSVLANPKSNLEHARLIAVHHRTGAGLELVGRRSEFVSDAQVQRRLLANPQLPDALLRKIISPKLLTDVYKIAVNREIPEKFMLASPDERAALLVRTEGRCLILLVNCALDARTIQMLTSKTSYTILFIQNLARWSATPPALLAHLLKQPVVRQNFGLRKQLLKHRNVPSEMKRNLS